MRQRSNSSAEWNESNIFNIRSEMCLYIFFLNTLLFKKLLWDLFQDRQRQDNFQPVPRPNWHIVPASTFESVGFHYMKSSSLHIDPRPTSPGMLKQASRVRHLSSVGQEQAKWKAVSSSILQEGQFSLSATPINERYIDVNNVQLRHLL